MKYITFIFSSLFFATITSNVLADIDDITLAEKLKQGGYVILVRHAITDHTIKDRDDAKMDNCTTQRNLSQQGRRQASGIGDAIKTLEIPVGKVYSSLYCRCIETAKLAFGPPETLLDLSSFMRESDQEKIRRVNVLRRLLGTPPTANTNTFIVTHSGMQQRASKVPLEEGDAAVFSPQGDAQYQLVTKVPARRWQRMLEAILEEDEM